MFIGETRRTVARTLIEWYAEPCNLQRPNHETA